VDREAFSKGITQILERLENVEIVRKEVSAIPQDEITIIATGPLTSEALSKEIQSGAGIEGDGEVERRNGNLNGGSNR
jgi:methylenetetrahydrofolate--tRNA-(uracil-5-)-methyltransferase